MDLSMSLFKPTHTSDKLIRKFHGIYNTYSWLWNLFVQALETDRKASLLWDSLSCFEASTVSCMVNIQEKKYSCFISSI
jgi:hypothetical protein